MNFSKHRGKNITNIMGPNAGVKGIFKLSNQFQLSLELLFSQNSNYVLPYYFPEASYGEIKLNYLEVPFLLGWNFKSSKNKKFHNLQLQYGFAYTKIISYKVEDIFRIDLKDQVDYGDDRTLVLQFGVTHFITKNLGLNIRIAGRPKMAYLLGPTLTYRVVCRI